MPSTCQLGRFFRRCQTATAGCCQYCGRAFCALHGQRLESGEEVCARDRCQRKVAELRQHLEYRAAAQARSARGFCGAPDCGEQRWGQCSRCKALFCQRHLHERAMGSRRTLQAAPRFASLCDHCLARRRLWSRL